MSLFQSIVCPSLILIAAWQIVRSVRDDAETQGLLRAGVLLAAALAVAYPDWVTRFANLLGIGRGADVVLYGLVFAFLAVSWKLYVENQRLRWDLTELIRQSALKSAGPPVEPSLVAAGAKTIEDGPAPPSHGPPA